MAADRVAEGEVRFRVQHLADRVDAEFIEHGQGHVNPGTGGLAGLVRVEELSDCGLVLRGDHNNVGRVGGLLAHRLDQLAATGDFVQEDE